MGRFICDYHSGENVWKYIFAIQPSEMYRITVEFKIGTYESECWEEEADDFYDEDEMSQGLKEGWIKRTDDNKIMTRTGRDLLKLHKSDIQALKDIIPLRDGALQVLREIEASYWDSTGMMTCGTPEEIKYQKFIKEHPDYHFWNMIKAIIRHMEKEEDPDIEEFWFEGEL